MIDLHVDGSCVCPCLLDRDPNMHCGLAIHLLYVLYQILAANVWQFGKENPRVVASLPSKACGTLEFTRNRNQIDGNAGPEYTTA